MLKIYQEPPQSGTELMRKDRELLEFAAENSSVFTVKFYEWDCPTISLGYHQQPELLELPLLKSTKTPWVRRPTGGAAVLHSDELTYSVVISEIAAPGGASKVHEMIGRALTAGLIEIGVKATLEARGEPLESLPNRTSCFARTSRWEVTVGGRKIVGSAQRKLGDAVLQHGSILLGNDHLRIVDFLKYKSAPDREVMRGRLAARSTSVYQELGKKVAVARVRAAMEQAFRNLLADLPEQVRIPAEVSEE